MSVPSAPRVLVGITTRNRASILPKALASLQAQQFPHLRVVVLDDASDDDATLALARNFPNVAWQRHTQPQGIIASRNELMREADADYFVCLDDDAWFLQGDEIALAVARLEAAPDVAAIAFDILSPDRAAPLPRRAPEPVAMYIGCGHVLRLAAARAVGFYAPSPGTYGAEEKDLCLRLLDAGHRVELLPGVHVWHDQAWAGRDWYPLHRSGVCNELHLAVRRCPFPDVIVVVPGKMLSFAWYWIRRPQFLRAGLAGVLQFLRHLPSALRDRAPVRRDTYWHAGRKPGTAP